MLRDGIVGFGERGGGFGGGGARGEGEGPGRGGGAGVVGGVDCGLVGLFVRGVYDGEVWGGMGRRRTSDSPADQRRSMSVNVRGAARTRREVARVRRVRVVGRKCIFGVGLGCGWVVVVVVVASCLRKRKSRRDCCVRDDDSERDESRSRSE